MRRRRPVLALACAAVLLAQPALAGNTERDLGRRFLLEARSQIPLIEDPAVTAFTEGLGNRLVATLGPQEFDYHFFVVASPSINAFAVPGGYVFVFAGLLEKAASDDEIAGVLGHEMGHVRGHHIVRQQATGTVWTAAALLGVLLSVVNPVLGAGAIAAAQTAQLKYSREFEQEADYLGLGTMSQAGYDPHSLASFFKQLLVEQRVNPAGVPPYMLSHPVTEERVAHVESIIDAQKLKTPRGRPAASPELAEVQAVVRAKTDPPDVVIAEYRRRAEKAPNDAEAQFLLGRVYQSVGQFEAARLALERSRDLGFGPRVDRPLGSVYVALKSTAQAQTVLRKYLATHPSDAFAHMELGKALADAGDDAGALKEFQRAVSLDPDREEAQRLLGLSLGRKGEQADGFYHLAIAARESGDLEQALSHFQKVDELEPAGTPRKKEVAAAIDELLPLVRDREMERRERARRRGILQERLERAERR
ncbi:MAG TPA: M48 family metalloprotease [Candidatus Eisenbacteria bacterium]|nr:M48 family metalloprotease [Candidatus Eisenbacteria bacterium]